MSVNSIEKALWQACVDPAEAGRLREDAPSYLAQFGIDGSERTMMVSWDVGGLLKHGVHPTLVLMAYGAVNGHEAMGGYMEKLYAQDGAAATG